MTQDYSVEIFASEEPDPPTPPGRVQRAGAHEVANGRCRAIAEVGSRFERGEVRRSHGSRRATRASNYRVAATTLRREVFARTFGQRVVDYLTPPGRVAVCVLAFRE
jgi:hypothetical protein